MRRKLILFFLVFCSSIFNLHAQGKSMNFMQSSGKIYVAIGSLLIIFLVLILYLVFIDRKVKRLENLISNEEDQ